MTTTSVLLSIYITLAIAFFVLFRKGMLVLARKDKSLQLMFTINPKGTMAVLNVTIGVIAATWPVTLPLMALHHAIKMATGDVK